MSTSEWFDKQAAKRRKHPEFILEQLTLDITDAVCRAMEERGLSRSDLARRLRVSPAYVTKLLNSTSNVTLRTLINIGLALDLRVGVELRPQHPEVLSDARLSRAASTSRDVTTHGIEAWVPFLEAQRRMQSQEGNESDQTRRAFFMGFAMGVGRTRQQPLYPVLQPLKRCPLSTVPDKGAREGEVRSRIEEWSRNSAA